MRHLTKTNKHFLLVGLTFLATSLIFYILAWLGQPSLENTLVKMFLALPFYFRRCNIYSIRV